VLKNPTPFLGCLGLFSALADTGVNPYAACGGRSRVLYSTAEGGQKLHVQSVTHNEKAAERTAQQRSKNRHKIRTPPNPNFGSKFYPSIGEFGQIHPKSIKLQNLDPMSLLNFVEFVNHAIPWFIVSNIATVIVVISALTFIHVCKKNQRASNLKRLLEHTILKQLCADALRKHWTS
jgi:hypothetical protein